MGFQNLRETTQVPEKKSVVAERLKVEKQSLNETIQALQLDIKEMEASMKKHAGILRHITSAEKELSDKKDQIEESNTLFESLSDETTVVRAEYDALCDDYDLKTKEYEALTVSDTELREKIAVKELESHSLDESIRVKTLKEANLVTSLEEKSVELSKIENKVVLLTPKLKEIGDKQIELDALKKEAHNLISKVNMSRAELQSNTHNALTRTQQADTILEDARAKAEEIVESKTKEFEEKLALVMDRDSNVTFREEALESKAKRLGKVKLDLEEHYGKPIRNIII